MATVQKTTASAALIQFNRPVGVTFINKAQDWQTRQKIQYESMLGLMKEDFHGLRDFREQMEIYSNANMMLKAPWMAIKGIVPWNRNILMRLTPDPLLGMAGRFLLKMYGFSLITTQPEEILSRRPS